MNKSEKFWDRMAAQFDKRDKHFEQTHRQSVENAKKHLHAGDIVLDYGCATGTVAIEIAGQVKEVHGIDISSKMIAAAKRKATERKIENVDFAQTTIFAEKYEKESVDAVLAFNIMHLLDDEPKVVRRINELLKPGGLFISITVCMGEEKSFLRILLSLLTKLGGIPYLQFFKTPELENSITNNNFKIIETEILAHNPTNYFIAAKKI